MRSRPDTVVVGLRLSPDWLSQADDLAVRLARPGETLSRSDILRMAIAQGLKSLRGKRGE